MHKNIICVPSSKELRNFVLKEMHNVPYVGYPGYRKTIATVRSQLFSPGMKKDVVDYISKCMEWKRVKVEHRHPMILLQPFPIPKKKWQVVTIYFITKFSRTTRKYDSIIVVVDKLANDSHVILVNMTHTETNIVKIYMREIARLHGIPKEIVSHKDTKFYSNI
jgi:hypothetical protein